MIETLACVLMGIILLLLAVIGAFLLIVTTTAAIRAIVDYVTEKCVDKKTNNK